MEVYKVTTAHAQGEEQSSNNCACARGGVYCCAPLTVYILNIFSPPLTVYTLKTDFKIMLGNNYSVIIIIGSVLKQNKDCGFYLKWRVEPSLSLFVPMLRL